MLEENSEYELRGRGVHVYCITSLMNTILLHQPKQAIAATLTDQANQI